MSEPPGRHRSHQPAAISTARTGRDGPSWPDETVALGHAIEPTDPVFAMRFTPGLYRARRHRVPTTGYWSGLVLLILGMLWLANAVP